MLPADFPGCVAIALHRLPLEEDERLPRVLSQGAELTVTHARDGQEVRPGQVVVAPANVHLKVQDGEFRLDSGPKENNSRPAIDVLFRSAACEYGQNAAGVLLSGLLDDGTAGLAAIRHHGGLTIVQNPRDALYGDMPRNAIAGGDVDVISNIDDIAALLVDFARGAPRHLRSQRMETERDAPSPFSCPDCSGVLWEVKKDDLTRFRCRTGHTYTPASLQYRQTETLEEALWAAIRALEEHRDMSALVAKELRERGLVQRAEQMERQGRDAIRRAELVRRALPDVPEAQDAGHEAAG